MSLAVVKVGTSSITTTVGELDDDALVKLASDLADARGGSPRRARAVGRDRERASHARVAATTDRHGHAASDCRGRPTAPVRTDASAARGRDTVAGQVLLTPYDFAHRSQYLHARETLQRLLDLGVLPIVNENDTVADDEIRYGDNDRLAALVSHLLGADTLLLLTDTAGLFTADPRRDADASLIEEIVEVDAALEEVAGGAGTERGSGGMASKLVAAKIAAWSGVRAVIASAAVPNVIADALNGTAVGTSFAPAPDAPCRAQAVDCVRARRGGPDRRRRGARRTLVDGGKSLLAAGVRGVEGDFDADAPVEIVGDDGQVFAKGLSCYTAAQLRAVAGKRTADLPEGLPTEAIHRDDLVVLP